MKVAVAGSNELRIEGLTTEVAVGEVLGTMYNDHRSRVSVLRCEPTPTGYRVVATRPEGNGAAKPQEPAKAEAAPAAGAATGERRRNPRIPVSGDAQVRAKDSTMTTTMKFTDISVGGVYVESFGPSPVGTVLNLRLQSGSLDVAAYGVVRVSHQQMGMGVEFVSFESPRDEAALRAFVATFGKVAAPAAESMLKIAAELQSLVDQGGEVKADAQTQAQFRKALERALEWMHRHSSG